MLQRWGTEVEDEETLFQLQLIKEKMGVKSKIRLLHYPITQSPMLLGFRDILIVLPELDYTEEELQLIFQHELTHYQHWDVLITFLQFSPRACIGLIQWLVLLVGKLRKQEKCTATTMF